MEEMGSQNIYRILMDEVDLRVWRRFGRVGVNIWVCRENGLPAYLVGVQMRSNKKSNYRYGGDKSWRDL